MEKERRTVIPHKYDYTKWLSNAGGPSKTQPDESLTIRQILDRYTKGLPTGASSREAQYDSGASFDSPDLEKVATMDLVDREDLKASVLQKRSELQKKVDEDEKARRAKKSEEESLIDEMKKDFKEKRKSAAGPPDPGRTKERNDVKE